MEPVVIVGAGPTGLVAANLLGRAGIETVLIERNAGLSNEPRAITIDDEGLRICQTLELVDEVKAEMVLDIDAHYLSRGRFLAKVAPTEWRNGYPLISTLHQPTFEAVLLKGLERYPCVQVCFRESVVAITQDAGGVTLTVRKGDGELRQIRGAYVLGCDGGRSTIRQELRIALRAVRWRDLFEDILGWQRGRDDNKVSNMTDEKQGDKRKRNRTGERQRWLVVDCEEDGDDTRAAIFFCNPARPAVTVPAPHGGRRWEFLLLPGEREEDMLHEERILTLIEQARMTQGDDQAVSVEVNRKRAGARRHKEEKYERGEAIFFGGGDAKSQDGKIARKAIYTFYAVVATGFARGRVFLLGDAAHLMPPFGGQGMNSGLRDAFNLCWKLKMVVQEQAGVDLLETYEQERRPGVIQMILFSELLGRLVMPTQRWVAFIRDIVLRGITIIPPVGESLREMRVKPQAQYRRGCVLPGVNRAGKRLRGRMIPQFLVQNRAGEEVLFDEVLGNGLCLLRLYDTPESAFQFLQGGIWERLQVRFVCIVPKGIMIQQDSNNNGPLLETIERPVIIVGDNRGQVGRWLGNRRDLYVLVRPDRYVMGAYQLQDSDRLSIDMQKLFNVDIILTYRQGG